MPKNPCIYTIKNKNGKIVELSYDDMRKHILDNYEQYNKELLKYKENAVSIKKSNEVDVRQQTKNGEGVGKGNTESESTTTESKPNEPNEKERQIGKYEKLAMEYAKKIDKVELPSWAKIDDANVAKQGGDYDSFKKALSKSVIEMGKLLDEGVEFAKAAKEAISHLLEHNPKADKKEVEDWFSNHYKENIDDKTPPINSSGDSREGGGTPPIKPQEKSVDENAIPLGITKASLSKVETAKAYFDKQGKNTWNAITAKALADLAENNKGISLEEAARNRVQKLAADIDAGGNHIADENDVAVITYLKHTIDNSLNNIDESDPNAYNFYVKNYQQDILNIAKALNKKGIGTALGMHNMVMLGMDNGFKVAKMEMQAANDGKPLNAADTEFLKQQYAAEIKNQEAIHKAEKEQLSQQFEVQVKEWQDKYNELLAKGQTIKGKQDRAAKRQQFLKDSGKELADKIRKGISDKGTLKADPLFIGKGMDLIIKGVAHLVEKGANLAAAIDEFVAKYKDYEGQKEKIQNLILDHLEAQDKYEKANEVLDEHIANGETTITKDMVKSGVIRDFVNGHILGNSTGEVIGKAFEDLKKKLPDATQEQLQKAYTKTGEFKQQSKAEKTSEIRKQAADVKSLEIQRQKLKELNNTKDITKNPAKINEINNQIELVKNTIKDLKTSMGLSDSAQGKLEKSHEKELTDFHNTQIDKVVGDINQQLAYQLTADEKPFVKETLDNISNSLKIDYNENSTLNQSKKLSDINANIDAQITYLNNDKVKNKLGIDAYATIKAELENLKNVVDAKRADLEQDVLIDNAIKSTKASIEKTKRDIVNNVYEEVPDKPKITKASIELTKLKQEQKLIRSVAEKKLGDLKKQNQNLAIHGFNMVKTALINVLIGMPKTFIKLIAASPIKTVESTIADAGAGKLVVGALGNKYEKLYTQALKGGFTKDNTALFTAWKAALMHTTKEKVIESQAKTFEEHDKLMSDVHKAIGERDAITDKKSSEYIVADKKVKDIQKQADEKYIEALANNIFIDFIGSNSTKAAFDKLMHRNTEYERTQGDYVDEKLLLGEAKRLRKKSDKLENEFDEANLAFDKNPNKENQERLENIKQELNNVHQELAIQNKKSYGIREGMADINYLFGFVGRSHGALKSYSGRFHFAMSFVARLQAAIAEGRPMDSDTMVQIAADSYNDFQRGMYQEHNPITDLANTITNSMIDNKIPNKAARIGVQGLGHLIKLETPITKVPVNMAINGIKNFALGLPLAIHQFADIPYMPDKLTGKIGMARRLAKSKVDGTVLYGEDGHAMVVKRGKIWTKEQKEQYKELLDNELSKIPPKYAADLFRMASSGLVGGFLAGLSIYALALKYGGGHHKGETQEDKKKGEGELKTAEMSTRFGKVPKLVSMLIEHAPSSDLTLDIAGGINQYNYTMQHLSKEKQQKVAMDIAATQTAQILGKFPQLEKTFNVREKISNVIDWTSKAPSRLANGWTNPTRTDEVKAQKKREEKLSKAANSYTLDPEKIIDYRTNEPIKREDYNKYIEERNKIINDKLGEYKKNKVSVENESGEAIKKDFSKLTEDELNDAIKQIREYATKKAKFNLWGVDKTTADEKEESKTKKELRKANGLQFSKKHG